MAEDELKIRKREETRKEKELAKKSAVQRVISRGGNNEVHWKQD